MKPEAELANKRLAEALKPKPTKLVKQGELENILALRLAVETLKRELDAAKDELTKAELIVIHAIDTGKPCEPGALSAGVQEQAGRRVPKWKEEFARVAGPEAVERVIATTEPTAATKKLVVMRSGAVVKGAE